MSDQLVDLSPNFHHLYLINRFPLPECHSACPPVREEPNSNPVAGELVSRAGPNPSRIFCDLLNLANNFESFKLEVAICLVTSPPGEGVAKILSQLPDSASTLPLDESTGSATLRAGLLAYHDAVGERSDGEGSSLARVATVSSLKKIEGSDCRQMKQLSAKLAEFEVACSVAGEDGGVASC